MSNIKTFLITGVSSGLGKAFAEGVLAAGHRVIGTVRNEAAAKAFAATAADRAHAALLDVTDFAAIPEAIARAECAAGPIDVLVNNAGYATKASWRNRRWTMCAGSSTPTCSERVAMIKAVLPGMRARRSGRIVNVTSMAASSPCRASPPIAAANSPSKASPKRSARR